MAHLLPLLVPSHCHPSPLIVTLRSSPLTVPLHTLQPPSPCSCCCCHCHCRVVVAAAVAAIQLLLLSLPCSCSFREVSDELEEEKEEGGDDSPTAASHPFSLLPISTHCHPLLIPTRCPSPCFATAVTMQLQLLLLLLLPCSCCCCRCHAIAAAVVAMQLLIL